MCATKLPQFMSKTILKGIATGRTDLVFDYVSAGHAANSTDKDGVPLIKLCAYYGDVSAIKFLVMRGESLNSLGENFDLNEAAFHGYWRLCHYLIEQGADVNKALPDTGETPLHAALCTADRLAHDLVVRVLLGNGANPNCATKPSVETGGFMRDCRTKAETPLHRAAAFGTEETIQMLLDAGASLDAKDMNGDSPLTWASWYLRPDSILRMLCYADFYIRPKRRTMAAYLLGEPQV
jgi:palmitoyltransferase